MQIAHCDSQISKISFWLGTQSELYFWNIDANKLKVGVDPLNKIRLKKIIDKNWVTERVKNIILNEKYVSKETKTLEYDKIIITDVILVTKTTITLIYKSILENLHET